MKSDLQKPRKRKSARGQEGFRGIRELGVDGERVSDEEAHMPT